MFKFVLVYVLEEDATTCCVNGSSALGFALTADGLLHRGGSRELKSVAAAHGLLGRKSKLQRCTIDELDIGDLDAREAPPRDLCVNDAPREADHGLANAALGLVIKSDLLISGELR